MHGLRLLDLGHDGGAAARDLLCLGDVFRALDEGERHPVDAGVERSIEIGAVLLRQRRERHRRVGKAYAFAVRQFAADLDARDDALVVHLGRDKPYLAVIEQERMARLDGGEDLGVRQVRALGVAGRGIIIEDENLAIGERGRTGCEAADPELGPLKVDQNADRAAVLALDVADRRHELAHAVVGGVTHIDAEDVGAGLEQVCDDAAVRGRRTEGRDDLGATQTSHQLRLRDGGVGAAGRPAAGGV